VAPEDAQLRLDAVFPPKAEPSKAEPPKAEPPKVVVELEEEEWAHPLEWKVVRALLTEVLQAWVEETPFGEAAASEDSSDAGNSVLEGAHVLPSGADAALECAQDEPPDCACVSEVCHCYSTGLLASAGRPWEAEAACVSSPLQPAAVSPWPGGLGAACVGIATPVCTAAPCVVPTAASEGTATSTAIVPPPVAAAVSVSASAMVMGAARAAALPPLPTSAAAAAASTSASFTSASIAAMATPCPQHPPLLMGQQPQHAVVLGHREYFQLYPIPQYTFPDMSGQEALWLGLEQKQSTLLDRDIVDVLAASSETLRRLEKAARSAMNALMALGVVQEQVVLYGSLSIGRTDPTAANLESALSGNGAEALFATPGLSQRGPAPGCFITDLSDVDCAALLSEQCQSSQLVERLSEVSRNEMEWCQVHATVVPRFSVTQWTMVSDRGVHLDLSFFSDPAQFNQFCARQREFRETFWLTRRQLQECHGEAGATAFDAYIYLLKAFAAVTSRSTLTSFQAICLGLFVAQRRGLTAPPTSLTGLMLLKRFLLFCKDFFAYEGRSNYWHGTDAIDISGGGRVIDRFSKRARAELYFTDAENSLQVHTRDWMNVLHNVNPETISNSAGQALECWFCTKSHKHQRKVWARLKRDLLPVMKLNHCTPR